LEFDIGFLLDVYFLIVDNACERQDPDCLHTLNRILGDRKRGSRSLRHHCCRRMDGARYGIWYARNDIVKTLKCSEVPKTPAT
jgi:hypothetical protein